MAALCTLMVSTVPEKEAIADSREKIQENRTHV
jgi:hypothetical protein